MECEYCKKKLSTKTTLKIHQRKTKYCLKIQGKNIERGEYKCKCGKDFNIKQNFLGHIDGCKYLLCYDELKHAKNEIKFLKEKNKMLEKDKNNIQKSYESLAKILANKSTITTNTKTITNNTLNLGVFTKTEKDIDKIVDENYDYEYVKKGQKGVAEFTKKHILNEQPPIYIITDKARCIGKYKKSETEIVTDVGMEGLTAKVSPTFRKYCIKVCFSHYDDMIKDKVLHDAYKQVYHLGENNKVFKRELVKLLSDDSTICEHIDLSTIEIESE